MGPAITCREGAETGPEPVLPLDRVPSPLLRHLPSQALTLSLGGETEAQRGTTIYSGSLGSHLGVLGVQPAGGGGFLHH